MHKLSKHFSPPLLTLDNPDGLASTIYHSFPSPDLLPSSLETLLREMGFGYRASFIESSHLTLRTRFGEGPGQVETGLNEWRRCDVDVVRERLLELKGVGRKVADCVMLMCLDQVSLKVDLPINDSHPSSPSIPMLEQSLPDIPPSLLVFVTSPCQNRSTMRSNLSCWISGDLSADGVRLSCLQQICQ